MQKKPVQKINQVLSGDCDQLSSILRRARYLQALTSELRGQLPAPLRNHCAVAGVSDGTLIVCADSAAWAGKVRFYGPALIAHLKKRPRLHDLRQVRVKISPPPAGQPAPAARTAISEHTAAVIENCATAVTDIPLQNALLRFARRARARAQQATGKNLRED